MKVLKGLKVIILSVVLVAFSASVPESEYFVPQRAASIFSCDINSDNHNDLIIGHMTTWGDSNATISLLRNNGNGMFTLYDTASSFCGYVENVFATRMNNDTFPDIIALHGDFSTGINQYYVRLLYNDGNGNFPTYNDFLHTGPYMITGITFGDIDGDQHQDIAVIINYQYQPNWGIFYNDGQGNLLPPVYYNLSFFPEDIKVDDLNNDSKDDIVIAGNNTEIFFSTISGFQIQLLNTPLIMMVNIADMNLDGNKDIIGLNGLFSQTTIYLYDGSQNFSLISQKQLLFGSYRAVISDLNNDSLPDLLILPYSDDGIYVMYNTGNFTLDSIQFIPIANVGENRRAIYCADLDGNGFNDIAMVRDIGGTGTSIENLVILFNDGQGHFLPDPITYIQEEPQISERTLKVYPNPAKDFFITEYHLPSYAQSANLLITDESGKKLMYIPLNCSEDQKVIQTSELTTGIYHVSLLINGKVKGNSKIDLVK